MGKQRKTNPRSHLNCRKFCARSAILLGCLLTMATVAAQSTAPSATAVPLILPSGLAYDTAGNLFFAESGRHLIRRLSAAGTLTTIAGTGIQGFAGDGGPATAALLDAPTALALDGAGNIFFSDSHNRRIRRVDAITGLITTLASPADASALAISPAGDVYFADPLNRQVRRVDHATGERCQRCRKRRTRIVRRWWSGPCSDARYAIRACPLVCGRCVRRRRA